MWSAIYWTDRTIFQLCDTNMLVKAWHHLLKGTFMQGKRNWCLDHLIHILVNQAIPHFIHKHHWQEFGFEGADLEVKKWLEIEEPTKSIRPDQIKATEEANIYKVLSGSKPGVDYCVDLDMYDCSCLSFPTICFCKHICAVQKQFFWGVQGCSYSCTHNWTYWRSYWKQFESTFSIPGGSNCKFKWHCWPHT